MRETKVIDNFLPPELHEQIKSRLLGGDFPWFYNNTKIYDADPDNPHNFQFTHLVYDDYVPHSPLWEGLDPIIRYMNAQAWVRIKCNLTTRTEEIYTYGMHQDIDDFVGVTGVYYVNDNNGYTVFDDGEIIHTKANRLVLFDSRRIHTGTSCTDEKVRCVINFNYFPNPEK